LPVHTRLTALVVASKSLVVLGRRKPTGLFGGLWEPPCTKDDVSAFANRFGVSPTRLRSVGSLEHVLSHRRMHVEVVLGPLARRRKFPNPGSEYDSVAVMNWGAASLLPKSALARKVLNLAKAGLAGLR
jgi:adenine-specific DNA glycosylase